MKYNNYSWVDETLSVPGMVFFGKILQSNYIDPTWYIIVILFDFPYSDLMSMFFLQFVYFKHLWLTASIHSGPVMPPLLRWCVSCTTHLGVFVSGQCGRAVPRITWRRVSQRCTSTWDASTSRRRPKESPHSSKRTTEAIGEGQNLVTDLDLGSDLTVCEIQLHGMVRSSAEGSLLLC